jgi:hypothetical protein
MFESSSASFFAVEVASLAWPPDMRIASKYFRLFVAADTRDLSADQIGEFAENALRKGMAYCCAWGPGCERFHDIVDEMIVIDQIGEQHFTSPTRHDTIMTTWHADETLEEALDFFLRLAWPTPWYETESNSWIALSVANPEWTHVIRKQLDKQR